MIYKVHRFSSPSEESRIRKMKGKLLLDDIGTATGVHPLYRKAKERLTGTKTLYHYTSSKNLDPILKEGLDPGKDRYSKAFKEGLGKDIDSGVYLGNQSKSIPRSTAIERDRLSKKKIREGKQPKEGWDDPGVMLTIKLPISEYKKMKKRESDPMVDFIDGGHKGLYKINPKYKRDYDNASLIGKLRMRYRMGMDNKHMKNDVILLQERVDPKYITKIDPKWS